MGHVEALGAYRAEPASQLVTRPGATSEAGGHVGGIIIRFKFLKWCRPETVSEELPLALHHLQWEKNNTVVMNSKHSYGSLGDWRQCREKKRSDTIMVFILNFGKRTTVDSIVRACKHATQFEPHGIGKKSDGLLGRCNQFRA